MDKSSYKKWVDRYLNENSDWEPLMCEAEAKVTAQYFGRTDKRKATEDIFLTSKKIKVEKDAYNNRSTMACSNMNLNKNDIFSSLESLMIDSDSYCLRKRKVEDHKTGVMKKPKFQ